MSSVVNLAKPKAARKDAVVVLGMHRSGTSAMSRVLSLAGAQLPSSLMIATPSNPVGHWEPQDVADFNDRLFAELDSNWSDTFGPREFLQRKPRFLRHLPEAREILRNNYGESDFIVLKEPRTSILLDIWVEALKQEDYEISYIIMVRHPEEVALSLQARDGFHKNKSLLLWATYMASAEQGTRGCRRIFVKHDDLIFDPEKVLDRVEADLGLIFPRRSWDSALEIQQFLKSELKHHTVSRPPKSAKAFSELYRFYSYLDSASQGEPWNIDVTQEIIDWLSGLEQATGPLLKLAERDLRAAQLAAYGGQAEAQHVRLELESARAQIAQQTAELQTALISATEQAQSGTAEAHQRAMEREAELSQSREQVAELTSQAEAQAARWAAEVEIAQARIGELELARTELALRADDLQASLTDMSEQAQQAQLKAAAAAASREALAALEIRFESEARNWAAQLEAAQAQAAFVEADAAARDRQAQAAHSLERAAHGARVEALSIQFAEADARLTRTVEELRSAISRESQAETARHELESRQHELQRELTLRSGQIASQAASIANYRHEAIQAQATAEEQTLSLLRELQDRIDQSDQRAGTSAEAALEAQRQAQALSAEVEASQQRRIKRESHLLDQLARATDEARLAKEQSAELARALEAAQRQQRPAPMAPSRLDPWTRFVRRFWVDSLR